MGAPDAAGVTPREKAGVPVRVERTEGGRGAGAGTRIVTLYAGKPVSGSSIIGADAGCSSSLTSENLNVNHQQTLWVE